MDLAPSPLAYATPEPAADRLAQVRRIYAWFALGFAVTSLLMGALHLYSMWTIAAFPWAARAVTTLSLPLNIPLLVGAAMMLNGTEAGLKIVRAAALALLTVGTVGGLVVQLALRGPGPTVLSPLQAAALVVQVMSVAFGVPALLFWLSFPLRRGPR